jgi:dihydroorotate dehydrogenase
VYSARVISSPGPWRLARRALFALDAERVHTLAMLSLAAWSRVCRVDLNADDIARHPTLARTVAGIVFPNPLGLAAGFDKDAACVPAWQALGFGFVEVGTVTARAQPGNPKPRLFRLPNDRALFNRLGFNNRGAAACARALERWRASGRVKVPVGVNIGKSKVVPNEQAADDYRESFRTIADVADYVVVNVSSPNTPGLRDLQKGGELARILEAVAAANRARTLPRPLFVKLAPDFALDDALACGEVAIGAGCAGLAISNTTIARDGLVSSVPDGPGGISGAPLFARSTEMLRALAAAHPSLAFIGVGGIEDGSTLQAKLDAGAVLTQSYTGFVYGGPGWVRRTLRALVDARAPSPLPLPEPAKLLRP